MKTSLLYVTTDFLIKAMQFALLPLASAALSVDEYVMITLYMTIITAATPLLTMTVESAYSVYFNPRHDATDRNVFIASLMVGVLSAGFWSALGLVGIWVFGGNITGDLISTQILLLIALYIVVDLIVRVEILGRRLGFRHLSFATVSVCYQAAKLSVALPFIFWLREAHWYIVAITAVAIIFAVVLWQLSKLRPRPDRETLKLVTRYTLKIAPVSFMAVANNSVDKIIIISLLGTLELANYHTMFVVAGLIQVFVLTLNKVHMAKLLSKFSVRGYAFLHEPPNELQSHAFLWFMVSVVAILLGRPVFELLFSDSLQFDFTTYSLLCWNFSIFGFYFVWTNILSLEERTAHLKSLGYACAIIPNIILSYMLTKNFGNAGAAFAALSSNIISALVLFALVRWVFGKIYFLREFLVYCLGAGILQYIFFYLLA